jgi:hypothetical protein
MANRFPLILDAQNGNKIKELPDGDNLNLQGSSIVNVENIQSTGTIEAIGIVINGEPLVAQSLLGLADTPSSYTGFENALLKVKNDASGIDFFTFEDFGDLTVDNILIKGNIFPEFDNVSRIGSEQTRFSEIWSNELRGTIKSYSGEIVFDATTGLISYSSIENAPTKLSEFDNDLNFVQGDFLPLLVQDFLDTEEVQVKLVKGSVIGEDSTVIVDGVSNNIFSDTTFANILQLSFSSEEPIQAEGTVALADGIGWDPLFNNSQSLVIYINGAWKNIVEGLASSAPTDISQLTDNNNLLFDGDYNSLTNTPTIPSSLTDLGVVDGAAGQVLTTDGSGNFTFGSVSGLKSRDNLIESTGSINNGSSANINITGYRGYMLYKIETSAAAWVRLYVSAAARTADAARTQGQDPLPGSGVVAEVITTGAETVIVAPGVIGFNNELPITNIIPTAVTNLSGGTANITVTLTAVEMEV